MNDEAEAVAAALRHAADLVSRHAPAGFENDVSEVRRRIGWIIAGLDGGERTCQRCGDVFEFDAVRYARERMPEPKTCPACRRRR